LDAGCKKEVYEAVHQALLGAGYSYDLKQVVSKIESLQRRYKGIIDVNDGSGFDHVTWLYFKVRILPLASLSAVVIREELMLLSQYPINLITFYISGFTFAMDE